MPRESTARWQIFPAGEFRRFASAWQSLNASCGDSALLDAGFVEHLLLHFGQGDERLAVMGDPAAPCAMTLIARTHPVAWHSFQPSQAPLGLWVQQPGLDAASLLRALLRSLPGFPAAVSVTHWDPDMHRRPTHCGDVTTVDYIDTARIAVRGTFDEFWAARDKDLRHSTQRRRKRLVSIEVTESLEVLTDPEGVEAAVHEFGNLESKGWKGREGTAVSGDNVQGRFYADVLRHFCARGLGRVYRYRFNERVVAMQLAIAAGRSLVFLKTTYDEDFRTHGPGILMQRAIVEQVFGEGAFERIEFYGRTGDPQARWCDNQIRTVYDVNCYRFAALPKMQQLRRRISASRASGSVHTGAHTSSSVAWTFHPASTFESHAATWEGLRHNQQPNPLLAPAFVVALIETFGRSDDLVAIGESGGRAVAMGVLRRTQAGSWQTFQPSQSPIGFWLKDPDQDWQVVLASLAAQLPGFCLVVSVSQQDPQITPRPQDGELIRTLDYIRTGVVHVNRPYREYLESRDKKVVKEAARRLRRLAEEGVEPRLEVLDDPAEMAGAVVQFGEIESAGWKGKSGTAVGRENVQGEFYTRLMVSLAAQGKARIYRYRFGERVAAMQLCAIKGGTLVFLKTTYVEELRRYSPGILMKQAIFEHCFAQRKLSRLEFYGRLSDWQTRWVDESRTIYHVTYYRWPWLLTVRRMRGMLLHGPGADAQAHDDADPAGTTATEPAPVLLRSRVYESLADLPPAYGALFEFAGRTRLFLTETWFRNFARNGLDPSDRIRLYAVERETDGKPLAILPMRHAAAADPLQPRTLTALASYYSPDFGPIVDPATDRMEEVLHALARAVAEDHPAWDVVDLFPLERPSPMIATLMAAFRACGMVVDEYFRSGNWYLPVEGRSFAGYLETLPPPLRNTIRRKTRQLETMPGFRLDIVTRPADVDAALEAYEQVYGESWKQAEPRPQFIRGLVHACAERGWLRMGMLYVEGSPVATQIWIVHAGTASIYKLAYDSRYRKLSAGSVLSAALMRHVLDVDKVRTVDYLSGDDDYKKDWMSHRAERWGLIAFNPRSPLGIACAGRHFGGRLIRRILPSGAASPMRAKEPQR